MSLYEAALNRLKEERLAVRDIREAILADEALKASEPAHRRQLLAQTLLEMGQLGRAIDTLTALEAGDLIAVDPLSIVTVVAAAPEVPEIPRQTGLIRRVQPATGALRG